jgi:hypothetical protein
MNDAVESRIFLSASVPLPSRHREYFDTADVIAIRDAVRALTIVVVEQHGQLVFGVHPAITPMIRRLKKPIVQIIGYKDSNPTPVPDAGRLLRRTWPNMTSVLG